MAITRILTRTKARIPTLPLWARFADHTLRVCCLSLIGGHVQAQAFQLGKALRKEYFDESSENYIHNVRTDLVDLDQVHARIKNGGEGRVVFDTTIALLQGMFPPTLANSIVLANETVITAPLGGYQYVPGELYFFFICWGHFSNSAAAETVEPSNDRSLESWTDCPVSAIACMRYQF